MHFNCVVLKMSWGKLELTKKERDILLENDGKEIKANKLKRKGYKIHSSLLNLLNGL